MSSSTLSTVFSTTTVRVDRLQTRDGGVEFFVLNLTQEDPETGLPVVVAQVEEEEEALELAEELAEELNPEACPGCGCLPGDGISADCDHPEGCGFWKAVGGE